MAESLFFLRVNVMPRDLSCCDGWELFHFILPSARYRAPWKGCTCQQGGKMPLPWSWWWLLGFRWEAQQVGGQPSPGDKPPRAVLEKEAGCAGWRWGVQGWLEASSMGWRCAGPRRSSGQTHRLASATREGDWLHLGTQGERVWFIASQRAAEHSWAERRLGERIHTRPPCNGTVGKGTGRNLLYFVTPSRPKFLLLKKWLCFSMQSNEI